MSYTMTDFREELIQEQLDMSTPEERRVYLRLWTPEERLDSLSEAKIRAYLAKREKSTPRAKPRKSRRPSR